MNEDGFTVVIEHVNYEQIIHKNIKSIIHQCDSNYQHYIILEGKNGAKYLVSSIIKLEIVYCDTKIKEKAMDAICQRCGKPNPIYFEGFGNLCPWCCGKAIIEKLDKEISMKKPIFTESEFDTFLRDTLGLLYGIAINGGVLHKIMKINARKAGYIKNEQEVNEQ